MTRAAGEQTNIYHTTDWSLTHRYPFGSGTSTVPAYIFTTADGRVAYCIEPAKFNSIYGHIVTGQLQYDKLSMTAGSVQESGNSYFGKIKSLRKEVMLYGHIIRHCKLCFWFGP